MNAQNNPFEQTAKKNLNEVNPNLSAGFDPFGDESDTEQTSVSDVTNQPAPANKNEILGEKTTQSLNLGNQANASNPFENSEFSAAAKQNTVNPEEIEFPSANLTSSQADKTDFPASEG